MSKTFCPLCLYDHFYLIVFVSYYLGTQLPLDRFLTFYYAHPGFHINNILIMTAVQFFMIVLVFLGTMNKGLFICKYTSDGQFAGNQNGCYNLVPVYDWIKRCVISIFVVFFIAFLPLFLQELCERGVVRAIYRLGKQFLSLSPIFEVFGTQISTHSILSDLSFGGARYIATGRGFATTRLSFAILYSRFAGPSIYLGLRTLLMLIYATMTIWIWHLTYFWITVCKFKDSLFDNLAKRPKSGTLRCSFPLQPTSILHRRLHHRLSRISAMAIEGKFEVTC